MMSNWNRDGLAAARRLAMSMSSNQVEHQVFALRQRHDLQAPTVQPEPAPLYKDGGVETTGEVPGGGQA